MSVTNVKLRGKLKSGHWRRISSASWRPLEDSTVTAILELPVTDVKTFLKKQSLESGVKLTMTHYVGFILGKVFAMYPNLNVLVRHDELFQREEVNLSFLVAGGRSNQASEDLSGVTLKNIDQMSLIQIGALLQHKAHDAREGLHESAKIQKEPFGGIKSLVSRLPWPLRRLGLRLTGLILFQFNLWKNFFGLERDAFGVAMITSVGMFGIKLALPRIYPFSGNVLMVCLGAAHAKPWIKDGQIVSEEVVNLAFAVDHRVIDGFGGAQILKTFEELFLNFGDIKKSKLHEQTL